MSTTVTITSTENDSVSESIVPPEHVSVLEQLRDFRQKIPRELLAKYERPTTTLAVCQIFGDWLAAIIGWQTYVWRPNAWTFTFALLLMAWSQRGISNLAHDCNHYNLFKRRILNDVVGDLFLAPAHMSTVRLQRKAHTAHHHYLGTKDDPDHGLHNETSLKHYRNGRFDHKTIPSLFLYDLLDPVLFYYNAVGSFFEAPGLLIGWWTAVALLAGFFEPQPSFSPVPFGWRFLALWHGARCTITYAIYVLREIIDHSGLPSTTILEFTRTSPCCRLLQKFLQPHDDNYHLLHHLLPRVPMGHLHELHEWLVANVKEYETANRYTSYFTGDDALFLQTIHCY
ncbi:hypothetical protein IEO21_05134 [Rhodonia placenta]|uniref:Fatty acid desaturase domain-containing protein n=1 Tax=Rhodonia placenta TaxID=104341 RepID=A0A8H7U1X4_9APHY|nr:hypothetical protein IEO21_05134 [Postia placenta]